MHTLRTLAALLLFAFPALVAGAQDTGKSASPALGFDPEEFDPAVRPQDDLYGYVNGKWLRETPIPADRSNYGAFTRLEEDVERNLKALMEEAAQAQHPQGSDEQKAADFYRSFMDSAAVEAAGPGALAGTLAAIDRVRSVGELAELFGALGRLGVGSPLAFSVYVDQKDATRNVAYVGQGGLGMPNRDYYLTSTFAPVRAQYGAYARRLLGLAGRPDPAAEAAVVDSLEASLARVQWSAVQNRDREARYNPMTLAEASAQAPGVAWSRFFEGAGAPETSFFILSQPSYAAALADVLGAFDMEAWKSYLRVRTLDAYAPYLGAAYEAAHFDFHGRALSGSDVMRPRWKRALSATEAALGEALGRLYVERHFRPEARRRMDTLVENLVAAFRQGIDELEWMSPETKREAQDKLRKFTPKVGYPERWKDYSAVVVDPGDLVGNVRRGREAAYARMLDRLGKPVDRIEWLMTPQTVNAYYNSSLNEIVFPAAILQPPFFNVAADDAVNYGGIGAVIGHEISHGFDDQGRKSDGDGNLRNWWSEADEQAFSSRAGKLVAQYDAFNPIDTMHVNGRLTLGENIGDLAGLAIAYKAYRRSLGGREAPVIDGFTGDQRFFIGWAQVWRRAYRESELKRRLVTDPHAPSEYRTNGIVANLPEFYRAFEVKPGDRLYKEPSERVRIW